MALPMLRALKNLRFSWSVVGLSVFYLYLGFHALSGNQGILKWANYKEEVSTLESEVERLKSEKEHLQLHADQLNARHLDLDRLDEVARRILNVSDTNETVVWLDETP